MTQNVSLASRVNDVRLAPSVAVPACKLILPSFQRHRKLLTTSGITGRITVHVIASIVSIGNNNRDYLNGRSTCPQIKGIGFEPLTTGKINDVFAIQVTGTASRTVTAGSLGQCHPGSAFIRPRRDCSTRNGGGIRCVQPKGKPVQASRRPSGVGSKTGGRGGAVAFVHFPPCDQITGFGTACEVELIIVGNSRTTTGCGCGTGGNGKNDCGRNCLRGDRKGIPTGGHGRKSRYRRSGHGNIGSGKTGYVFRGITQFEIDLVIARGACDTSRTSDNGTGVSEVSQTVPVDAGDFDS